MQDEWNNAANPMIGTTVFSIWVGKSIPDKYLLRMNTVWSRLFAELRRDLQPCNFIIYTDNIKRMHESIASCDYEIHVLKTLARIQSISILLDLFDTKVNFIRQEMNQSIFAPDNSTNTGLQFCDWDNMPLREHHKSWAVLSTCYLRRLLWKDAVFAARGTLNLRLLALALHGGLYLDWDIMTIEHKAQEELTQGYRISKEIRKKLQLFDMQLQQKKHQPKEQMQVAIKFVKMMNSGQYVGLQLPYLPFLTDTNSITASIASTKEHLLHHLQHLLTRPLRQLRHPDTDRKGKKKVTANSVGILAISSDKVQYDTIAKYSQNILYAGGTAALIALHTAFLTALRCTMSLAMLPPGNYWVHKTNRHLVILPRHVFTASDCTLEAQIDALLQRIVLPFDVFFTREKFPYLVTTGPEHGEGLEVTFRTGRPLHPLGQIATRGSWNFLLQHLEQFPVSSHLDNTVFSAVFHRVHLFPESSLLSKGKSAAPQNEATHWTKVTLNRQLHIHDI